MELEHFSINNNSERTTCGANTVSSIQSGFEANTYCFKKYGITDPEFVECVHAFYCKKDQDYCLKSDYPEACYYGQGKQDEYLDKNEIILAILFE